jgi:hypothetical protein
MLEKTVEDRLVKLVKEAGGKAPKCERLGKNWPDRIPLLPYGRMCFVELKRPEGTEGVGQELVRKMLTRLGFDCFCLYTLEQVEEWKRDWLDDYLERETDA